MIVVRLRDGIRVCIEVAAFCVVCVLFWLSTRGNTAAESDQLKTAVRIVGVLVHLLRGYIPDHGLFEHRVRLRAYHPLIRRLAHMSTTS
jgi:hypothetical protein